MEEELNWLKKEIAQGFTMLAALNLKGRPAAADLKPVAILWLKILSRQQWQFERDAPRVRSAFEKLAAESNEWPNPADFTRVLPPEPLRLEPRLEDKHTATEYGRQMAKEIIGRLKDAPVFQTEWIHGPKSRSVDECRRIYAARQKQKGKQHD